MSHTPGPWFIDPCSDDETTAISADGRHGLCIIQHGNERPWGNPIDEANARLIIAAPDLLATCEKISTWLRRLQRQAERQAEANRNFPSLKAATEADAKNYAKTADHVDAAIAKALPATAQSRATGTGDGEQK